MNVSIQSHDYDNDAEGSIQEIQEVKSEEEQKFSSRKQSVQIEKKKNNQQTPIPARVLQRKPKRNPRAKTIQRYGAPEKPRRQRHALVYFKKAIFFLSKKNQRKKNLTLIFFN